MYRNTCRVNLSEARVCEESSLLVALESSGTVAVHGICRKEICISISSGCNHNCVCTKTLNLTCYKITGNDTFGLSVYNNEIKHLMTRIRLYSSGSNLFIKRSIRTEKKLLSGLSASIESTAYLHTSERTVGKISAVFTGKWNTLCYTLVNNGSTYFSKTIHISLSAAVVTSLDSIIEETIHGVIVVLIILCSIDTTLSCNRVRSTRGIADTENFNVVAEFTEGCGCGCSAKTCTHYNDFKLSLVVGTHKMDFRLTLGPFLLKRSLRDF